MRALRPGVVVAVLLLAGGVARANLAASRPNPAVGGSLWTAGTHLAVDAEALTLDCVEVAGEPRCAFVARYEVRNDTEAAHAAVVAFVGDRVEDVTLSLDGRGIDRALGADELEALLLVPGARRRVQRKGGDVAVPGGGRGVLEARGTLKPGRFFRPTYEVPAVRARHPVLGTPLPSSQRFHLEYVIAPLRSWGGGTSPRVAVTLRTPAAWAVDVFELRGDTSRGVAAQETQAGDVREARFELDSGAVDELELELRVPPPVVLHGGPFVAVGGTFGPAGGLRARVGYELGAPHWLVWAVSGETDFQGLLQLALVAEAATNVVLVVPSLSFGLGVPLRVLPEVQPGVRAQVTLQWPYFGVVTSVDVFPAARDVVQVSLLGRLSL